MQYIFLLILLLGSCAKPNVLPQWRKEMAAQGVDGATTKFNAGWRDGCQSGSATAATPLQRLYYGFKMDEQLIENDEYYNAWNKAFVYCHRYLYQYHKKVFSN